MRLWSLHPRYLDPKGLVALWREALLAQAVLANLTRGYRFHPQLSRFRSCRAPLAEIAGYLRHVHAEAELRGYRFDRSRISPASCRIKKLPVTRGQLEYEWELLLGKLTKRNPLFARHLSRTIKRPEPHPLFEVVPGAIADWERPKLGPSKRTARRSIPVAPARRPKP